MLGEDGIFTARDNTGVPSSQLRGTHFMHIDGAKSLMFSVNNERVTIDISSALRQTVLRTGRIEDRVQRTPRPRRRSALPVSRVRSLVHTNTSPTHITRGCRLDRALMHHFSVTIRARGRCTVRRFLTITTPGSDEIHAVDRLIRHALTSTKVNVRSIA